MSDHKDDGFVSGIYVGMIAGITLSIIIGSTILHFSFAGSQGMCRMQNPGYECVWGWVKGEAFK